MVNWSRVGTCDNLLDGLLLYKLLKPIVKRSNAIAELEIIRVLGRNESIMNLHPSFYY